MKKKLSLIVFCVGVFVFLTSCNTLVNEISRDVEENKDNKDNKENKDDLESIRDRIDREYPIYSGVVYVFTKSVSENDREELLDNLTEIRYIVNKQKFKNFVMNTDRVWISPYDDRYDAYYAKNKKEVCTRIEPKIEGDTPILNCVIVTEKKVVAKFNSNQFWEYFSRNLLKKITFEHVIFSGKTLAQFQSTKLSEENMKESTSTFGVPYSSEGVIRYKRYGSRVILHELLHALGISHRKPINRHTDIVYYLGNYSPIIYEETEKSSEEVKKIRKVIESQIIIE